MISKERHTHHGRREGGRFWMCVLDEGEEFRVCLGSPLWRGLLSHSLKQSQEKTGENLLRREPCMFRMAQARLLINQLLLISAGSYLPHCAAQTQRFSLPFRTTFSPLKQPTFSSPWPLCTCPGMTTFTQKTYKILPCDTQWTFTTLVWASWLLKWHRDIPLNVMPSLTILLFTSILIPKIAFFKCGSIQNGAQVSGSCRCLILDQGSSHCYMYSHKLHEQ